jgi:uncharacterized protein
MSTGLDFREPIGWPLLPVPDARGELAYPDLARSVRDHIQVLLATQPGEQLMRPSFGAGLEALLGEPNTIATRARIRELVQQALARWEKRITVDAIAVDPVGPAGTAAAGAVPEGVRVEIAYRLIRTQQPARIGMTLVLGSQERSHAA